MSLPPLDRVPAPELVGLTGLNSSSVPTYPVNANPTGCLQVTDERASTTLAGSSFSTVLDTISVASTAEMALLYITNPVGSGKTLKVNRFGFTGYSSTSGNNSNYTQWRVYLNPTVLVNGTAESIVGQIQTNQNTSVVLAYKIPTTSANGQLVRSVRVNSAVMSQILDEGYNLWIEPGHSMLVTYHVLSTGGTLNLDLLWSEE